MIEVDVTSSPENYVPEVQGTEQAIEAPVAVKPKRIRKPAPKAPVVDYKKNFMNLDRECAVLLQELETQRTKNEILFKQLSELKGKLNETEQKNGVAINMLTEKVRMLGNDIIMMLQ